MSDPRLATVGERFHICPGCDKLCAGPEYCAKCGEYIAAVAKLHADRAAALYDALPRVTGAMPGGTARQTRRDRWTWRIYCVAAGGLWLWIAVDVVRRWLR